MGNLFLGVKYDSFAKGPRISVFRGERVLCLNTFALNVICVFLSYCRGASLVAIYNCLLDRNKLLTTILVCVFTFIIIKRFKMIFKMQIVMSFLYYSRKLRQVLTKYTWCV